MASLRADTVLDPLGPGQYGRVVDPAWAGTSGVVGGHSLALMVAAVGDALGSTDGPAQGQALVSLTSHFFRPVAVGEVTIEVEALRAGRATAMWRVAVRSEDRIAVEATAVSARPLTPARFDGTAPPQVGLPGEGEEAWDPAIGMAAHDQFRFWRRFDDRGSRQAVGGGWILPRDDFPTDARLLAMASDVWFPPVLERLDGSATVVGLTHTLHLRTADVGRSVRDDEPVLVHLSTELASGGTVDETCHIWSANGALLATATQVRLLIPMS